MKSCTFRQFFFSAAANGLTYSYTPANTVVAAFHFTIALLSGGPTLLTHPPVWYKPELVKTEKDLEDEELKDLLSRKLRESKKDKKKKANGETKEEEAAA